MFYSTNDPALRVGFTEAVLQGIAPDGGLYMPCDFPLMPPDFFQSLPQLSFPEMSLRVARQFLQGAIPDKELEAIVYEALSMEIPLVRVNSSAHALELFHGPTMAFKDVGARFLARTMSYLTRNEQSETMVLVATSGDTGSAVAHGFYQVPGVRVCLLYPSGKVSPVQEQQLTTLGENITALEVQGTFDDCQRLVKEAFAEQELKERLRLTSANSINIARLLPQVFYYFLAYARLEDPHLPLVFSVPSGNFGNLTAGLFAWKMGLPAERFIASTNRNDVVPEYLASGRYRPRPSLSTISNAMDVGAPSNFARMDALFSHDPAAFRRMMSGYSFSDASTRECIRKVYQEQGYMLDPHGAVAFLGLDAYTKEVNKQELNGVFLETAHPAKFLETVEEVLKIALPLPAQLSSCLKKRKKSIIIGKELQALKEVLLVRC